MFSKTKADAAMPAARSDSRNQTPSIISASLRIVGNLVSDGDVQVDGIVDGDVKSRSLTISEGAAVNGAIVADDVRIRGAVRGQISARSVMLGSSAHVTGDVVHTTLVVEAGAFLEGHCRRLAEPAADAMSAAETQPAFEATAA